MNKWTLGNLRVLSFIPFITTSHNKTESVREPSNVDKMNNNLPKPQQIREFTHLGERNEATNVVLLPLLLMIHHLLSYFHFIGFWSM